MPLEQMAVMGTKGRVFAPLPPVTLEDLVPPDHFYRHLERSLDLSFVRDLVRDTYPGLFMNGPRGLPADTRAARQGG